MFNEFYQLFSYTISNHLPLCDNDNRKHLANIYAELSYKGRSGIQPLSTFHVSFLIVTIACNFSFSPIASHVFWWNVPHIVSFAPHHVPFRSPITPSHFTLLIVPPRVFHFIVTRSRIQTFRKLVPFPTSTHHHFILLFRVTMQSTVV